jgi:HD-GYP domain-containing protein (c-di-GMP phosphodiesterase class II)
MPQLLAKTPASSVRPLMSEIISALTFGLDLTEGQPMGHCVNSCLLGMRIAEIVQIPERERADLYFALLLKDTGCSSNASRMFEVFGGDDLKAKREVKTQDWSRVTFDGLSYLMRNVLPGKPTRERMMAIARVASQRDKQAKEMTEIRCERGAQIALRLGFPPKTAQAIRSLDEHWNGKGYPRGLRGQEIPVFSRIMNLAQTLEVYATLKSPVEALQVARERSATWFDPEMVRAAASLESDRNLWAHLKDGTARDRVVAVQPDGGPCVDDAAIDNICEAFAGVIDAKSLYTNQHSKRVAKVAVAIGEKLGLESKALVVLRRAGLLHDIGMLGVPNSILDKPGELTEAEWEAVRLHTHYTQYILEKIPGFQDVVFAASRHHEKLDGSGYHRNLRGTQLSTESRVLAVADVFDALSSARSYRAAMPLEKVFETMKLEVPHSLDAKCFEALRAVTPGLAVRATTPA